MEGNPRKIRYFVGYGRGGVCVQANCIQVRGVLLIILCPTFVHKQMKPFPYEYKQLCSFFSWFFRYSGGKSEEIMGDMDCLKDSKV